MADLTISGSPTAPVVVEEPLTLAEVQAHLRVDSDDDQALIEGLITAAREYCETAQGRAYVTRSLQYTVPVASSIELPFPPLAATGVTGVTAILTDGTEEAISTDDYNVNDKGLLAVVTIDSYPSGTEYITVEYDAGYGAAADVPQRIKQMLLLLIGWWYEHPETEKGSDLPPAIQALLNLDRVNWGM